MTFPNLTDLAATTIENRSQSIADSVTAQNAVLMFVNKSGNVKPFDGGTVIQQNLSFAENGNGGSYSGYDQLPTASQDVISAAQYRIAQYAVPVVFSGQEQLINAGKEEMLDLVEARVKVAESTMLNLLNRHMYLDGTGNNGKNLTGLGAAVVLSPTNVYGGIDRSVSTNAFWKNQKFQASVDGTGAATSATIQGYWNTFMISLTRGGDRPKVIVCAPAVYSIFESSLQAIQRITDADKASAGFKALDFQGVPVVFDTAASGINANAAYFLNTDYIFLRPHSARNMTTLKDKQAFNQDATVSTLVWAGNLTTSGAKFQGYFQNN